MRAEFRAHMSEEHSAAYELAAGFPLMWPGLARYAERLASSRRIKAKVLPWAFGGMGLLMVTFILGGGAHTRAIPSWIHGGLGYLSLAYSIVAFLVEAYYLLQQNSVVNAFQRELVGARE